MTTDLAVQVKQHWGTDNKTHSIKQLRQAFDAHGVDAGLLVTFADELGGDLQAEIEEVQKEHNLEVLYGEDLYGRLLDMVADPTFDPEMLD